MKPKISANPAHIKYHRATSTLSCLGTWTLYEISKLEQTLLSQLRSYHPVRIVDASGISRMDTGGAWLFNRLITDLQRKTKIFPMRDSKKSSSNYYSSFKVLVLARNNL